MGREDRRRLLDRDQPVGGREPGPSDADLGPTIGLHIAKPVSTRPEPRQDSGLLAVWVILDDLKDRLVSAPAAPSCVRQLQEPVPQNPPPPVPIEVSWRPEQDNEQSGRGRFEFEVVILGPLPSLGLVVRFRVPGSVLFQVREHYRCAVIAATGSPAIAPDQVRQTVKPLLTSTSRSGSGRQSIIRGHRRCAAR